MCCVIQDRNATVKTSKIQAKSKVWKRKINQHDRETIVTMQGGRHNTIGTRSHKKIKAAFLIKGVGLIYSPEIFCDLSRLA